MTAAALSLCLFLAPDGLDELEALQTAVRAAVDGIDASVVRIETAGGVRRIDIPGVDNKKMSVPERPREGDRSAPEKKGEEEEPPGPREGRTPRFQNEWEKMLALPGFKKAEGPTTGLIISADGYIVTSAWNFDSDPNVVVVQTGDGKTYAAALRGIDRAAGIALIKIEATGLKVPAFLDPRTVRVGSWAFALGRALARERCEVKYGIISAKNRIEGNALQTDAATSPTNYGGPLIDVEGRVYGILVPLGARGQETNPNWYDSGIGFCAPIPDPARLIERLGKPGTVLLPAFLGVEMEQDRTEAGGRITNVIDGHGAAKAGLEKGDVILRIDGIDVENPFSLRFAIGRRRAGDKVQLVVQRGSETLPLEALLGPRPEPKKDLPRIPVPRPNR